MNNVREYRTKLLLTINDKPVAVTLTGSDEQSLKTLASGIFQSQPNLSSQLKTRQMEFKKSPEGTIQLFHEAHANGKSPVGWTTQYEIPYEMSVEGISETQQKQVHKVA